MNRSKVIEFFDYLESQPDVNGEMIDLPELNDIVTLAATAGFKFSELELESTLNQMILSAHSLPRPWGWPLVRRLGLVRS
jgi:hypothetical protein